MAERKCTWRENATAGDPDLTGLAQRIQITDKNNTHYNNNIGTVFSTRQKKESKKGKRMKKE